MNDTQQSAENTTANDKTFTGLTDEERGAMKERTKELKAEARRGPRADKADGERAVLAKIAEMPEPNHAPGRAAPRNHHGQRPGPVAENLVRDARLCQGRQGRLLLPERDKFKSRYATFGFDIAANLDEGAMWPVASR